MNKVSPTTLGDLIEFQRGYDLPKSSFIGGEFPVQSSNGILGYHNEYKVEAPGVTIGRSGTVGLPHLLKTNFFPHNTTLFVKDFKGNNVEYIYYLLRYLKLGEKKSGSGVPTMNRNHLHPIKIAAYRSPDDQKAIASVLSSLDTKIELNNSINAELEQMAKTLYDYWFVQFDFPNEKGKPYKSSGGKMVYNGELKREIPEGWLVKPLSHWINEDKGGDWGKESEEGNYTEKVNCIRGTDINGLIGKGESKAPIRYILEKNSSKILQPNDLIIEISGGSPTQSTGRLAYIIEGTFERFDNPIICSNFCKAINLKDKNHLYYFAYYWNLIYDNNILFGWEGKTSGIKNLLFDSFVNHYQIPVPDESLIEKFNAFVKPIEAQKQKKLKENQELASLRDWLLPMLMNGQVTVRKAHDKAVKEAVEKINVAAESEVEYKKK